MVEVDTSGHGVGAILWALTDNQLHPCIFLLHHSPAKQKYAIGEQELLVVKLALEKWCHWLEGTEQPFMVWTDHRNLQYLQSAKRLNP